MKKKKKTRSKLPLVLMIVLALLLTMIYAIWAKYTEVLIYAPDTVVAINKGDTIAKFYAHQKGLSKFMTKLWIRNHVSQVPALQE